MKHRKYVGLVDKRQFSVLSRCLKSLHFYKLIQTVPGKLELFKCFDLIELKWRTGLNDCDSLQNKTKQKKNTSIIPL